MLSDRWESRSASVSTVSASGGLQNAQCPSVLIVTPSSDDAAVFGAIFKRHGIVASATRSAEDGLQLALAWGPKVILLDEDAILAPSLAIEFAAIAESTGGQVIALGKLRTKKGRIRGCIEVAKPFHYDTLIPKIEAILMKRSAA